VYTNTVRIECIHYTRCMTRHLYLINQQYSFRQYWIPLYFITSSYYVCNAALRCTRITNKHNEITDGANISLNHKNYDCHTSDDRRKPCEWNQRMVGVCHG
jgi:hypothetical protein